MYIYKREIWAILCKECPTCGTGPSLFFPKYHSQTLKYLSPN